MQIIFEIVKLFILFFFIFSLLLYTCQGSFIFYPRKLDPDNRDRFSKYEISVNHDGVQLHGWFVKGEISEENPLLIYYGGNAEEVSYNLWYIERYNTSSFLFMNYRGYGMSKGKPTETNLFKDALFLLDYITEIEEIPVNHIVLMGRSIGSSVAIYVASHRKVRGVILVSPFDSLVNLGKHHYPIFPVRYLLKHKFETIGLASQIKTPALNIIGSNDSIIPNKFSLNLIRHWGGPYRTVEIKGATHNDISDYEQYWKAINDFLSSI